MARKSAIYRISKSEDKLVSLMRDDVVWNNLISFLSENLDYEKSDIFIGLMSGSVVYTPETRPRSMGLTVTKRLYDNEYCFISLLRDEHSQVSNWLSSIEVDSDSDVYMSFSRFRNLISKGVSKDFDSLCDFKFMSSEDVRVLKNCILRGYNIVISGDLDSGKVTLLNAIVYALKDSVVPVCVLDDSCEISLDFSLGEGLCVRETCSFLVSDLLSLFGSRGIVVLANGLSDFSKEMYSFVTTNLSLVTLVDRFETYSKTANMYKPYLHVRMSEDKFKHIEKMEVVDDKRL